MMKAIFCAVAGLCVILLSNSLCLAEPTKANQSAYEKDIRKATTSRNLTKADLAWHALNTYGWDCEEVISKGFMTKEGYFVIKCSSGKEFRVYPRQGKHPKITNINGTYK